jgi:hypothetical protein
MIVSAYLDEDGVNRGVVIDEEGDLHRVTSKDIINPFGWPDSEARSDYLVLWKLYRERHFTGRSVDDMVDLIRDGLS